jgi:RecA/RadA recombinase
MAKKFNLNDYKTKKKIASTPKKRAKFIELDECLQDVLGMSGVPLGHITQVYGLSDTGKTSLLFHSAAKAQEQGILPIIVITEGKVDWNRARTMGFKYTGDLPEDEQEEDFCIVQEDIETLEAGFKYVIETLNDVEMGRLPQDVMIFWDSIGNTPSVDEFSIDKKTGEFKKEKGMMKAARVISENLRIVSPKVNNSLKISHPNYAGLMFINHAYTEPPAFIGGHPKLVPYGGKKIWYCSSLVLKTAKKQKLSAVKDGTRIGFGIVSKIVVDKNHVTNSAFEGEFVITADTIMPNDKLMLDTYKKQTKENWGRVYDEQGEEFDE